jgi:hypothetical protein
MGEVLLFSRFRTGVEGRESKREKLRIKGFK